MTFQSLKTEHIVLFVDGVERGRTCVDEDVSAEVVGASEGRRAVLANVRLVSWRQAASITIQDHCLLKTEEVVGQRHFLRRGKLK